MPRRCSLGCKSRRAVLHVFPNPNKFPKQFEAWVKIVTGNLDSNFDHTKHRICDIHFTHSDKNRNQRLNKLAVPSLFLPEKATSSEGVSDAANEIIEPVTNGIYEDPLKSYDEIDDGQTESPIENPIDTAKEIIEPVSNEMHEDPLNSYDEIDDGPIELPIENPIEIEASEQEEKIYSWQKNSEFLDINQDNQNSIFQCDFCKENITGYRYTCVQCNELDLCSGCESRGEHDQHYVLRIPPLRPYDEVQELLASIRRLLNLKFNPTSEKDDIVSVKSEIKSEIDEPVNELEVEPFEGDNSFEITSLQEGTTTQGSGLENDDQGTVTTIKVNPSYNSRAKTLNMKPSRKKNLRPFSKISQNDDQHVELRKYTFKIGDTEFTSSHKKKIKIYGGLERSKGDIIRSMPVGDESKLSYDVPKRKPMLKTYAVMKPVQNEQPKKPDVYIRLAKDIKKTGVDENS